VDALEQDAAEIVLAVDDQDPFGTAVTRSYGGGQTGWSSPDDHRCRSGDADGGGRR
jgi:hypothetical protein